MTSQPVRLRFPLRRHFWPDTRSAAAIEVAIIAPLMLVVTMMFLDVSKAYREQVQIVMAVSAGAEFAFLGGYTGTAPATLVSEIASEVVAASALLLDTSNVSIAVNNNPVTAATTPAQLTAYWAQRCCLAGGVGSAVIYTCSSSATTCADTANPGLYLTISASLPFSPYFSSDLQMTGETLGSSIITRIQ